MTYVIIVWTVWIATLVSDLYELQKASTLVASAVRGSSLDRRLNVPSSQNFRHKSMVDTKHQVIK